jgi:hypothetical protein
MLKKIFGRPDVKETVKKSKTDIRKGVRGESFLHAKRRPGKGDGAPSALSRPSHTSSSLP